MKDKYYHKGMTVAGGSLYVDAYLPKFETKRPPILAVCGAFDGSWIFSRIGPIFAATGWPLYAMNPRGYYKSRYKNVASLSLDDYVHDVETVRRELHLHKPVLLGYSVGGLLAELSALKSGAEALLLYDPSPSREVANFAKLPPSRDFVDAKRHLPPVIQFIPSKAIVEEMWGRGVNDREYQNQLKLFKQSFLSGKALREMEIDRPHVPHLPCPALVLGIDPKNVCHKILYREYGASWYAFEGYSHGSLLVNPKADRIARMALSWLASGHPTGSMKHFRPVAFDPVVDTFRKTPTKVKPHKKEHLVLRAESHLASVRYYSGWRHPKAVVVEGKKEYEFAMRVVGEGRRDGEKLFEAVFEMNAKRGFFIRGEDGEDHPSYGRLYTPTFRDVYLRDGRLYSYRPPLDERPPQFVHLHVPCKQLDHEFHVTVRLPRNYYHERTYPVAILNDGQNQWTNHGMLGGWHTDTISDHLVEQGHLDELILVGIDCHKHRNKGYLPPPLGRADLYCDWVAYELLPQLRHRWKMSHDPYRIAMIGASYGANISVYCGLRRPDVFGLIGSLSFAYIKGNPQIKEITSLHHRPFRRAYIDCGTAWALDQPKRDDNTKITMKLWEACRDRWMTYGKDVYGRIEKGHLHNETFWRHRIGPCLKFLFKRD